MAGAYFAAFLVNRTTIDLQTGKICPRPAEFSLRFFKSDRLLEDNPSLSQRYLAKRLDISLGKVNFCLNALVGKGCLKVNNFRNSDNKLAYAYQLTPNNVEEKARMTVHFLNKMQEYERLRTEIEELKREVEQKGLLENVHE